MPGILEPRSPQVIRDAIKLALAVTVTYGIAMSMNWDNPKWAIFAVAVLSLDTIGQSLNKAFLRMAGTLLAAVVALTLIALFAQDRWPFMISICLWLGFCAYMNTGPRHQYFWYVAAFVAVVIAGSSGPEPGSAFSTAVLRVQQTALGILVYTVIALFLWPKTSRNQLLEVSLDCVKNQRQLFDTMVDVLLERADIRQARAIYQQQKELMASLVTSLEAAESDSDEVRAGGRHWREYRQASLDLAESMRRWSDSFQDVSALDLPELDSLGRVLAEEFRQRIDALEAMLAGHKDEYHCQALDIALEKTDLSVFTPLQRTAIAAFLDHLRSMDNSYRQMVLAMQRICGIARVDDRDTESLLETPLRNRASLDPERLLIAVKVMLLLAVSFLLIIYVPAFPGGFGFLSIVAPFSLMVLGSPQLPLGKVFGAMLGPIAFSALLYVFVMPHLSSFYMLAPVIFLSIFAICYLYSQPQDQLSRALSVPMFAVFTTITNQGQVFSFLHVANTALMVGLLFILLYAVSAAFYAPIPQHTFVRMRGRFFDSARVVLRHTAQLEHAGNHWRYRFHCQRVMALPGKMKAWLALVNDSAIDAQDQETMVVALEDIHSISYRLQVLDWLWASAASGPRSDSFTAWASQLDTALDTLARPAAVELAQASDQLCSAMSDLESSIGARLECDENDARLYHVLCTARGLTDKVVEYAECTGTMDWQPWLEERFA